MAGFLRASRIAATAALLTAALVFLRGVPALAVGLNCQRPHNRTETAICNTPELLGLDETMRREFEALPLTRARSRDQSSWEHLRNVTCLSDVECLRRVYETRLSEIRSWATSVPPNPDAASPAPGVPTTAPPRSYATAPGAPEQPPAQAAPLPPPPPEPPHPAAQTQPQVPPRPEPNPQSPPVSPQHQVGHAQPSPPPPPAPAGTELGDRSIWEGKFDCGLKAGLLSLVIFQPVAEARQAFVIVRGAGSIRSSIAVGQIVFRYELARESTLNLFRLSAPTTVFLGSDFQPERQLEFALDDGGETLHGGFGPSCSALTLTRQRFTPTVADLLAAVKAHPGEPPPAKMTSSFSLSNCIVLSAWAAAIRAGFPGLDPRRISMADQSASIFRASVFHPAFARAYTDIDFAALRGSGDVVKAIEPIRQCAADPVAFENAVWIDRVFIQGLDQGGLVQAAKQLQDIADKVQRIAQSVDRLPANPDGLRQITGYIAPIENDLAHAVPQTRDAILTPAYQRQAEMAAAILQEGASNPGGDTFDELVTVKTAYDVLTKHPGLLPNAQAIAQAAERRIETGLQTRLAAEFDSLSDAPVTLDSLVTVTDRAAAVRAKYAPFAGFASVDRELEKAAARATAIQAALPPLLQRQVGTAKDVPTISTIRTQLEAIAAKNADLARPLWTAYHQGLRDWIQADIDAHPAPAPASPEPPPSVFTSSKLRRTELAASIYQSRFQVVYTKGQDAHYYVERLALNLGRFCPESTTGDFIAELERRLSMADDIIQIDPQRPDPARLDRLARRLAPFLDPSRVTFIAQFLNEADADSLAVHDLAPCDDPALALFMHNAKSWFDNPFQGVPSTLLNMSDLCHVAMPDNSDESTKDRFCRCAGPALDVSTSTTEKTFIRLDPKRNFWTVIQLEPDSRRVNQCQR